MSRILFWVGLICLIVFAIRSKIRNAQKRAEQQMREAQQMQQQREQQQQAPGGPAGYARGTAKAAIEAETMLECAHCGVFFPASEAVRFDGAIYCSKAHAALPPN